jgi:hypothetical protein
MIIFLVLLCVSIVLGLGWAAILNPLDDDPVALISLSIVMALVATVVSWTWALGIGAGLRFANTLTILICLIGWVVAIKQRKPPWRTHNVAGRLFIQICNVLVLFLFALIIGLGPKLSANGNLGMALRVGPDALGNVIAGDALYQNQNLKEIETRLVKESQSNSLQDVLKGENRNLYRISSFRSQVEGEFLVAGLRWGLSGAIASSLSLVGEKQLWAVAASLPALSVLAGMLLLFRVLCKRVENSTVALLVAMATYGNISLLQGWHEGGLGQAFVTPIIPVLIIYLWNEKTSLRVTALLGSVLAFSLVAYSDIFIVLVGVLAIFTLFELISRNTSLKVEAKRVIQLSVVGASLALPYLLRFIGYLPRRLQDSSIGGWSMETWPSPIEILGVVPTFYAGGTGLIDQSNLEFVITSIFNPLIISGLLVAMVIHRRERSLRLLMSIIAILFLVLIKSKFMDQATNYQYIKALGCLAPFIVVLASDLILKNQKDISKKMVCLSSCLVLIVATAIGYVVAYRNTSLLIPASEQISYQRAKLNVDSFNLIAPSTYETVVLSPFVSLDWINRDAAGTRPWIKKDRPLAVLILERDCTKWQCLNKTPAEQIFEISETTRLVRVCPTSKCVMQESGLIRDDYVAYLNRLITQYGLQLNSDVTVAGPIQPN